MKITCPHCRRRGVTTIVADEMPGVGVRIRVRGGHGYDVPFITRCECARCGQTFNQEEGRIDVREAAKQDKIAA
jgi:hypothetical protein